MLMFLFSLINVVARFCLFAGGFVGRRVDGWVGGWVGQLSGGWASGQVGGWRVGGSVDRRGEWPSWEAFFGPP